MAAGRLFSAAFRISAKYFWSDILVVRRTLVWGLGNLKTGRWRWHLLRTMLATGAMFGFFLRLVPHAPGQCLDHRFYRTADRLCRYRPLADFCTPAARSLHDAINLGLVSLCSGRAVFRTCLGWASSVAIGGPLRHCLRHSSIRR